MAAPSSTWAATAPRSSATLWANNRPVEVMLADTLVHPIPADDNAIALHQVREWRGGQFE